MGSERVSGLPWKQMVEGPGEFTNTQAPRAGWKIAHLGALDLCDTGREGVPRIGTYLSNAWMDCPGGGAHRLRQSRWRRTQSMARSSVMSGPWTNCEI